MTDPILDRDALEALMSDLVMAGNDSAVAYERGRGAYACDREIGEAKQAMRDYLSALVAEVRRLRAALADVQHAVTANAAWDIAAAALAPAAPGGASL